jgi:hypothetical protein
MHGPGGWVHRAAVVWLAASAVAGGDASAQRLSGGAHLAAVLTHAAPTAGARSVAEGALVHPMAWVETGRGVLDLRVVLNAEGLVLQRGELSSGAVGEGYFDRRHPHSYVHELMAGAVVRGPRGALSLHAGRGFVPFGSDDPMVRPAHKYPVNHHLAQLVERPMVVGAARRGPLTLEGALFAGREPSSPGEIPAIEQLGDSWSARVTWTPVGAAELSASMAQVESPELRARHGLDHRKHAVVARWQGALAGTRAYVLGEWARTAQRDGQRTVFRLDSWLVEGQLARDGGSLALRVERTLRGEEERTSDPFRSPVPHPDLGLIGMTRWTTTTVTVAARQWGRGPVHLTPFAEGALALPRNALPGAAFDARTAYGASRLWMLTAGVRAGAGAGHGRMGRYGAAMPPTVGHGAAHAGHGGAHAERGATHVQRGRD